MTVYLFCVVLAAANPAESVASPDVAAVRTAVSRSLPYVVERGTWWIEKKKCVSCHRVGNMVWALNDAAERGFDVDRAQLQTWIDWSFESLFDKGEKKVVGAGAAVNADGLSQLLLGTSQKQLDVARRTALTKEIVAVRQKDGSWKPEGQLPGQKRPLPETTAVSTMWQTLALSNEASDGESITSAEEVAEPLSTEWWVVRLVLSRRRGETAEADRAQTALLKRQRDDGGWGWLSDDESDALATGMALYALADVGLDGNNAAVGRAWKFLIDTQRPDGAWDVKGTKTAKKDGVEETASYWGATWAVIGLVRTLPK